jgi:hypothetical protein
MEQVCDGTTSATAHDMARRTGGLASDLSEAVRERPYTTLAVAAGLAFALGALWRMRRVAQPPASWRALLDRMAHSPNRNRLIGRSWGHAMPTRSARRHRLW